MFANAPEPKSALILTEPDFSGRRHATPEFPSRGLA